jgi:putative FmdB family regulatory protein
MPTYEYECRKCGRVFDRFQKISDPPLKRCPECRGVVKRRIGTGAGLLFKGSGFYITDYRSESYKKAASTESGAGAPKEKADKPKAAKKDAGASGKTTS